MAAIFFTGGSGFLGQHLIRKLIARGDEVRSLERSETSAQAVAILGAAPVRGDLSSVDILRAGMEGCGLVYHCAAHTEDWGDPAVFHQANVMGTENVLRASRAAGVRRLVHVSTEAVLLSGKPLVRADESWPLPEKPLGLYPKTKGEAERRVLAANQADLETVIVRPRAIWGQGDTVMLPSLVQLVAEGRFAWFDHGQALTSTCHVSNVVEGLTLAAERGRRGEIYFLTDGEDITVREYFSGILAARGVTPPDRSVPFAVADALARLAEAAWRVLSLRGQPLLTRTAVHLVGREVTVDDTKARRDLGYVGQTTRAEGLAAMRA